MSAAVAVLDALTHTYSVNGEKLSLSVSRVLQESGIAPAYPPEAMSYVEAAREKGEAVHQWCEYADRGGDDFRLLEDPEYDQQVLPYILAYQRFRTDYLPEWQFIEMPFHRDDCGGTPDRIGTIAGEIAILDIKTPKRAAPHWQIQLSAYQWIGGLEKESLKLYVLLLGCDATYRLLPYESDIPTWECALHIARWKLKL